MNMAHARAFWVHEPGCGAIREESLPAAGNGEVSVCALYSGISRGTETLVFEGRVPESEYQRMRAPFQQGDFPAPVKYGYASVGRVTAGPENLLGRTVFCLYPHQDRFVVDAGAVRPVPEGVPAARAVLAANAETAVNALWDAPPRVGDRIAVVGAGTLGCLVAWLAGCIAGTRVELVDTNPARSRVAHALGVGFASPSQAQADADIVFHTSASSAGLDTAIALAGFEAQVVELSWYGDRSVSAHLGGAFHARRLELRSSQVGGIAPSRRGRRDHAQRLDLALSLLADERLDALFTGEDAFEDLPQVMRRLSEDGTDTICHRIRFAP